MLHRGKKKFHRVKSKTINTLFCERFFNLFSLAIDKISVKNKRGKILKKNRLSERSE
jgi:ribosomal protein L19